MNSDHSADQQVGMETMASYWLSYPRHLLGIDSQPTLCQSQAYHLSSNGFAPSSPLTNAPASFFHTDHCGGLTGLIARQEQAAMMTARHNHPHTAIDRAVRAVADMMSHPQSPKLDGHYSMNGKALLQPQRSHARTQTEVSLPLTEPRLDLACHSLAPDGAAALPRQLHDALASYTTQAPMFPAAVY